MFYITTVNRNKQNTAYTLVMNPAQNTACNHNALDIHRFFCSLKKVDQFQLPGYSSHLLLCNYPQHFTELLLQNMGVFTVKKTLEHFISSRMAAEITIS